MKEHQRNWSDIGAGVFFLLIGVGALVGATRIHLGTPAQPQPGLFPFLGGVFIVVMSSVLIVRAWLGYGKRTQTLGEIREPAILVAGLAVYVGILNPLGYVLATIFLGVVVLWVLGIRSWRVIAATSLGMSVGTYLVFCSLLGVELPAGLLEGIWIF
jgi:putative tricarboxylic transport membrane protein